MMERTLDELRSLWRSEGPKLLREEQRTAPNFNIFRLLRREEDELSHSAFIGSLLDPGGAHSQGGLFLRAFLETVTPAAPIIGRFSRSTLDDWRVVREKAISWGRLDIVVSSNRHEVLIVIENKVNADEGIDQIERYRTWVDSQSRFKTRVLAFLTLEGISSKSRMEDLKLSYRHHIRNWLDGMLSRKEIRAPKLHEIVTQYLQALPLENYSMNKMDRYAKALATPKYIETALEVGDRVATVKTFLFEKFYAVLRQLMEKSLGVSFLRNYEFESTDYGDEWASVCILPKGFTETRNYAYWRIEKCAKSGDGVIVYGIATNGKVKGLGGKSLQPLIRKLEYDGFDRTNPWWIRRKFTEHDLRNSKFWLSIATDNSIAIDLVKQMVLLIRESKVLVENVNRKD